MSGKSGDTGYLCEKGSERERGGGESEGTLKEWKCQCAIIVLLSSMPRK